MPQLSLQLMKRRIQDFHERLRGVVFDGHIGLDDTVILASMGRSGSTFVSDLINCDNTYRVLFEPFRFDRVSEARNFVYPLYLRPDNTDPRFLLPAQKILTGKVHSQWIDKKNRAVFPKKRLIKDIRINMILKWLRHHFPEVKIILLVRHPCAVVESWMAVFGAGRGAFDKLRANELFVQDIGSSIMDKYQKAEPGFESLVFLWCVSYWAPFHQFSQDELYLLFYEDLLIDPDTELENLFSFLGHTYSPQKAMSVFSKPSSTVRECFENAPTADFFARKRAQNGLSGAKKGFKFDDWMTRIASSQLERAYEIMSLFGLETLYSPVTGKPNKEIALNLFGAI